MIVKENISLAGYHTFHCRASARYLVECPDPASIHEALREPKWAGMPQLILGGGSNLLFTKDFPGVVICNALKGIGVIKEDDDRVWIRAEAGETWHDLVQYTVRRNWGGLENLSLIPGKVGAAPMQNIGAYGVELKDVFESLDALHREDGTMVTFDAAACEFGYRDSIFKNKLKDRFVITSVTLCLSKKPVLNTSYGAIEAELERSGALEIGVKEVSEAVCRIRSSKLPDPGLLGNAGSFFKNPVVKTTQAQKLQQEYGDIPLYPQENEMTKVAAGWLIEKAGWKGFRKGDTGVHKDQALVLVNYGNATGEELLQLSGEIRASVKSKFGIELEREVNVVDG